jgi:hypothetical protein
VIISNPAIPANLYQMGNDVALIGLSVNSFSRLFQIFGSGEASKSLNFS